VTEATDLGWGAELPHLIRQSARYLPSRFVPALLGMLTIPLLARLLNPSGFGSYSLVAVALPYVSALGGDWVVSGFQRQAQRRLPNEEAQAFTWLLIVSFSGTVILLVTAVAGGPPEALGVALLLVPSLLLRLQWTKLQMLERAAAYSWLQVAYSALRLVSLGGMAALTARADFVVLGWVLATWLIALLGPRLPLPSRPSAAALRQLAVVGVPLIGASLTINFAATADRFIVASLLGRDATGIYSLGYLVGESLLALPASVVYLAAYAVVMRLWDAGDKTVAVAFLGRLIHVQLLIMTVLAMLVSAAGGSIVRLLGGEAYTSGGSVVGVIAGAQVAAGLPLYLILVATLRRETRLTLWPSVTACLFNIVLTVPAVLVAGIKGAALATVVTYLFYAMALLKVVSVPILTPPQVVALLLGTIAPSMVTLGGPLLVVSGLVVGAIATLILLATLRAKKELV
jgi:O-antigen/teichoic acid export membrane protein